MSRGRATKNDICSWNANFLTLGRRISVETRLTRQVQFQFGVCGVPLAVGRTIDIGRLTVLESAGDGSLAPKLVG